MDFLREEIESLKNLGHDWEMEKSQIEEAIMKAIAGYNFKICSKDETNAQFVVI